MINRSDIKEAELLTFKIVTCIDYNLILFYAMADWKDNKTLK